MAILGRSRTIIDLVDRNEQLGGGGERALTGLKSSLKNYGSVTTLVSCHSILAEDSLARAYRVTLGRTLLG